MRHTRWTMGAALLVTAVLVGIDHAVHRYPAPDPNDDDRGLPVEAGGYGAAAVDSGSTELDALLRTDGAPEAGGYGAAFEDTDPEGGDEDEDDADADGDP